MNTQKIELKQTGFFSDLFTDYLNQCSGLKEFYSQHPQVDNFEYFFDQFDAIDRQVLTNVLEKQHDGVDLSEKQQHNLTLLNDKNTFTVTTGHQLNIFCGPLFFIYKIISTIKSCEQLKEKYPDKEFVPIYWMATEDHDFEEINHFRLFNQTHTWQTKQTGAVGRMMTDEIRTIFEELKDIPELFEVYKQGLTLAEATRRIVHHLFKQYGLLILDADDKALKNVFKPVIKEELTQHTAIQLIQEQTEKLDALGYKGQVYPRTINLFYLEDDRRARIEQTDDGYVAIGTDLVWSKEELLELAETHPERFSPNVALRPVYQQMILPNIAYIGGPGELAYWLQLSAVFTHHQVVFPALMPRNFGLYINKGINKKIKKFELAYEDLFKPTHELKADYIAKQGVEFSIDDEQAKINELLNQLANRVSGVDASLKASVEAESKKITKQLGGIEKRVKKSQEAKHQNELTQLMSIKEKLFPNGGLQERQENFLNFYINDAAFIDKLYAAFEPFDYKFHVIIDD